MFILHVIYGNFASVKENTVWATQIKTHRYSPRVTVNCTLYCTLCRTMIQQYIVMLNQFITNYNENLQDQGLICIILIWCKKESTQGHLTDISFSFISKKDHINPLFSKFSLFCNELVQHNTGIPLFSAYLFFAILYGIVQSTKSVYLWALIYGGLIDKQWTQTHLFLLLFYSLP